MNVRMPDGTIIRNVPQGTTRAQLQDRLTKLKNAPDRTGFLGHFDAGLRGATDMMTFGLADKIAAAANTILPIDKLSNSNIKSVWETGDLGKAFRNNLGEEERIAADDQQNRFKSRVSGQVVGGVLGPVPGRGLIAKGVGKVASMGVRGAKPAATVAKIALEGAAQNGMHGLLQGDSLDLGDRLSEGANEAGAGALGSLIGAGVVKGGARLLSPIVSPAVQKLADLGVVMTPGQRAGAGTFTNWFENVGSSIPGLRVPINAAKARGLGQYMKGVVNEGLKPISKTLPKNVKPGRTAIEAAQNLVSDHYDEALAKVRAPIDETFQKGLADIAERANQLPPEQAQAFHFIMQNKIAPILAGKQMLDGQSLQTVHRTLQQLASKYDSSGDPAGEFMADELRAIRQNFFDLAARHSPDGAEKFAQANAAEANLNRVYDAASKAHGDGIPTPRQMSAATARKGYGTTTKTAAAGKARLQDVTDAGAQVLPDTMPNTGSGDRMLFGGLVTGVGGGSVAVNPAIAGLAVPAVPYLPGVDELLQKFALRGQGKTTKALADEVRKRAYIGGMIGAPALNAYMQGPPETR